MLIYSVEDDEDIALIINKVLTKQGFDVKTFKTGNEFLKNLNSVIPNIVLLDLMLPDISGSDIIKLIRKNPKFDEIHIIVVSAKHMTIDKVENLDLGADDYIEKPFEILELMSRVEAHARRLRSKSSIIVGDLKLNNAKHECTYLDKHLDLTTKEFEILALLIQKAPNVVTRDELFEKIWNTNQVLESRTLDMHIKSIRTKLNDDGRLIKSIYGIGYKLNI